MTTNNPIRFIRDEAAAKDFFGSHSQLAEVITSVICEQSDIQVIGLLGSWGSGKTTVIKYITEKLSARSQTRKFLCFTYDAWLHQNDPQRRSFLESLVHFLRKEDERLLHKGEWQARLDTLNGQIEEAHTINTPLLTTSGKFLLLSLFGLQLGTMFLNVQWYNAMEQANADWIQRNAFWIGAALVSTPLILLCSIYWWWRPLRDPFGLNLNFFKWKNLSTHRSPHQGESLVSIFMNKEVQKRRNKTIKSPEPTTIEFQDAFRDLIERVSAKETHFLFIIDNLDRLPPAEALEMWATIRSFFLGANESYKVRKKNVYPVLLLPVDEAAIRQMYAAKDKDNAEELAKSFMEKTFDLTFKVTKPVASDWKDYLSQQLKFTFHEHVQSDWSYIVSTFFEVAIREKLTSVTPRSINTCINKIASLWLQWHQTISFPAIAYFAIFRTKIDEAILEEIRSDRAGVVAFDTGWQRAVAAMHYGVRLEKAWQVLLDEPMRAAIAVEDFEELNKLAATPGFNTIFERYIDELLVSSSNTNFTSVAQIINSCNQLQNSDPVWLSAMFRKLRSLMERSESWSTFEPYHIEALAVLLNKAVPTDRNKLIEIIQAGVKTLPPTIIPTTSFSENVLKLVNTLCSYTEGPEEFEIPSAANYLEILHLIVEAPEYKDWMLNVIKPLTSTAALTLNLNNLIQTDNQQRLKNVIAGIIEQELDLAYSEVAQTASTVARQQPATAASFSNAIHTLGCLYAYDQKEQLHNIRASLKSLANEGIVVARLHDALHANNIHVAAMLGALGLILGLAFNLPDGSALDTASVTYPSLLDAIADHLIQYSGKSLIETLRTTAQASPVHAKAITQILTRSSVPLNLGSLYIEKVVSDLDEYLNIMPPELQPTFMERLPGYGTFWDTLEKTGFTLNTARLFKVLIEGKSQYKSVAIGRLIKALNSLSVEQWTAAFSDLVSPINIAIEAIEDNAIAIEGTLFEALNSSKIAALTTYPTQTLHKWYKAAMLLAPNSRLTLFRSIKDYVLNGMPAGNLAEFIKVGGSHFLNEEDFLGQGDNAARHIIDPLLRSGDGIEVLLTHSETVSKWVAAAKPETGKHLETIIISQISSNPDTPEVASLEQLGKAWSLNITPTDPSSEKTKRGEDQDP